jgi:SAM-dependent methyltransferase
VSEFGAPDNFNAYAHYYDLFYADKEYKAEATYVNHLLGEHERAVNSVLELGCGTGRHAVHFAEAGMHVHGIDRNADMLVRARHGVEGLRPALRERVTFSMGDVRTVRVDRKFDAAVSLFHVMSYQTSEQDIDATLETAAAHVHPGGVFVFDFWHGPAVLTDRPCVRVKRVEDEHLSVTRIAEPVLHQEVDVVDVHFQVFVRDNASGAITEFREKHPMRYYFLPYLRAKLAAHGFDRTAFRGWLGDHEPSLASWYAVALARRG